MKTNISVSRFIYSLRNEQSNYVIALIMICILSLILISSIVMNGYEITSLIVTSKEEMQKVADLHMTTRPDSTIMSNTPASRWDFFGSAELSAAPSNFSLLGIEFSNDDPVHAKAIISANSGEAELYSVGDKLGPGTVIDRIDQNDVILLHNGVRQTLSLTWEGETEINNPTSQEQSPSISPRYNTMMEQMRRFKIHGDFPSRKFEPVE